MEWGENPRAAGTVSARSRRSAAVVWAPGRKSVTVASPWEDRRERGKTIVFQSASQETYTFSKEAFAVPKASAECA